MVTIYVRNKPLYLINQVTAEIEECLHRQETIFIDELNPAAVRTMLREMENDAVYTGVFLHQELEELVNAFKAELVVIQAAGGLVYTQAQELLLIFRKGKWDLPKGKLDEGETLEYCAMREIEEETGATGLTLKKPLTVTYHTYYEKEKHILKESHWFLLSTPKKIPLKAQAEEDIEECKWVAISETDKYIANMHASIVDVLKKGIPMLKEQTA